MALSPMKPASGVVMPTGAGRITPIDLKVLPARIGKRVAQMHSFLLRINLAVVQDALIGVAVDPKDLLQLYQIRLWRNGKVNRINCSAWDLFVRDCAMNGGVPSVPLPQAIPANLGVAAETTNLILTVPITFMLRGMEEELTLSMPAEAYRESGRIEIECSDPAVVIDPTITLSSATVDVIARFDTRDEVVFGADTEIVSYQSTSVVGTEFQFDPSTPGYLLLIANPYAIGGGEFLRELLASVDGTKYDAGRFPVMTGDELITMYLQGNSLDLLAPDATTFAANPTNNIFNQGIACPIIAPQRSSFGTGKFTHNRYSVAKYWKIIFDYTGGGGTLANGERYLVERVIPREPAETAAICARLGMSPAQTDQKWVTPDGKAPTQSRAVMIPFKLVPGTGQAARPRGNNTAG